MSDTPLTLRLQHAVRALFGPEEAEWAADLLRKECSATTLPSITGDVQLERIRAAVLKISQGRRADLSKAASLAQTDWRDLLLAAGFGTDIRAHEAWLGNSV